jgi:hypothetical protein
MDMFYVAVFKDRKVSNIHPKMTSLFQENEFRYKDIYTIACAETKEEFNDKIKQALRELNASVGKV